jgi:hypothetical protein
VNPSPNAVTSIVARPEKGQIRNTNKPQNHHIIFILSTSSDTKVISQQRNNNSFNEIITENEGTEERHRNVLQLKRKVKRIKVYAEL